MKGSAVSNMSSHLQDFGGHGSAKVGRWCEISSKRNLIVREGWDGVVEHYPVVPCELANGIDIGSLSRYGCSPYENG